MLPLLRTLLISLLALAGLSAPCWAQGRIGASGGLCQDAHTNFEAGKCFDLAYEKADGDLKLFLAQVRNLLAPQQAQDRDRLDKAQEAWMKYRDLTCDAESQLYFDHGSGSGPAVSACLEAETRLRLNDLHAIYDWKIEQAH